jgi:hypothetical protein
MTTPHVCDECGKPAVTTWHDQWKCVEHYPGPEQMKKRLQWELDHGTTTGGPR